MITSDSTCIRLHSPVSKLYWMRVNRILAWALVVSPPVQWVLHMRFMTGLAIDLVILLAHAVMSFALFGKPETKQRVFSFSMHVMGIRDARMSERNRFLLSGYRIALGAAPILLQFTPFHYDVLLASVLLIYPLLRLPVSVIRHLYLAVRYALRRWGVRESAPNGAAMIVATYVLVSLINLFR